MSSFDRFFPHLRYCMSVNTIPLGTGVACHLTADSRRSLTTWTSLMCGKLWYVKFGGVTLTLNEVLLEECF